MSRPPQISDVGTILRHRRVVATLVLVLVLAGLFLLGLASQQVPRGPDVSAAGPTGSPTVGPRVVPGGQAAGRHSVQRSQRSTRRTPVNDPVNIEIPRIGVHTKVIQLGLAADGTVQVPPFDHADEVGWYTQSPVPGDKGPSVLIGHIDSPQGPAVFYRLATLAAADQVRIQRKDGTIAVFKINAVRTVTKSHFPTRSVYGNLKYPGIRLITCGGAYDATEGGYQGNTIAYGSLVKISPAHS